VSRYASMFERLGEEGAFIPFVTLGDPEPGLSAQILEALVAGGADALELGIPFSDPTADGPTIQAAAARALEAGVTPADCWKLLASVRAAHPDLPIGLLVYANLVVNHGTPAFYAEAAKAGVDSVLIADAPTLEIEPFAQCAAEHGIEPVLIAPPNADAERLQRIAQVSRGYTYVVTRSGVTGANDDFRFEHERLLTTLKEAGAPPPVFGFGISKPEHARQAIASGAAGAISGSAVVAHIPRLMDDPPALVAALTEFVRTMKAATR